MVPRLVIALLVAIGVAGCQGGATSSSPIGKDRPISARSTIDNLHRLALDATMLGGVRSAPGMTPLRIVVQDLHGDLVRDAIVYVELSSVTDETPRITLLATNRGTSYGVDLPLVYGSRWTFIVKAFSGGRNGIITVNEDLN